MVMWGMGELRRWIRGSTVRLVAEVVLSRGWGMEAMTGSWRLWESRGGYVRVMEAV